LRIFFNFKEFMMNLRKYRKKRKADSRATWGSVHADLKALSFSINDGCGKA
jgi:hypothetical protein